MASATVRRQCTTTTSRPSLRPHVATSRSRKLAVVRANMLNDMASGFMRIFTPMNWFDNKKDWENTGSGFSGKISRERKPFKDGWTNSYPDNTVTKVPVEEEKEIEQQESNNIVSYMSKAASRVATNNFKGDPTEPEHWKKSGKTASMGFKGDLHGRKKDGFHSNVM